MEVALSSETSASTYERLWWQNPANGHIIVAQVVLKVCFSPTRSGWGNCRSVNLLKLKAFRKIVDKGKFYQLKVSWNETTYFPSKVIVLLSLCEYLGSSKRHEVPIILKLVLLCCGVWHHARCYVRSKLSEKHAAAVVYSQWYPLAE
jgi:hypothetical protein